MHKRPLASLFPLAALLLAVLGAGCESKPKPVRPIDAKEAYGMLLNEFAVVIDVREEADTRNGMADRAESAALSKIRAGDPAWKTLLKTIPKSKQAIFYGAAEADGREAAEAAAKEGVDARVLGSFTDWRNAGYPIKKP